MKKTPPESPGSAHLVFGEPLTVDSLWRMSAAPFRAALTPEIRERIERGRAIVEDVLRSGSAVYGTNTGIGSQKDVEVKDGELADFSDRMIISEATNAPGALFEEPIVRGALAMLCHNLAQGRAGIRLELAEALLELLESPRLPPIRRDCAFGVADLTPLSQLVLPLLGRALDGAPDPSRRPLTLAPKESVSLIDNNSFGLAEAAFVLRDARRLLIAFDAAAAVSCEGLRAGMTPHFESAAGGWRGDGQVRARRHLLGLLRESSLYDSKSARFLQDPLSFRGITQIHGAAYEALDWAIAHVEADMNAAADNPLVDFENGTLVTSSSMISVLPTMALDCLRQVLAKVAVTSHERSLKVQSPPFSGLPVGLSAEHAADGGILSINLHYIGSARLGTLSAAAAPVLLHYIGHTADGVEDVSTLLPLAAAQTRAVIERAWELAVLEMIVGVWAIARRELDLEKLGKGPRRIVDAILPDLHIGSEGVRIFDLARIVEKVRQSTLIEELRATL